jgi:hypothetical protein
MEKRKMKEIKIMKNENVIDLSMEIDTFPILILQ